MSSELIEKLRTYASCDIADALQKLKHPLSGFLPGIVLQSPVFQAGDTKVIGEVSTVKFVRNEDTTSPRLNKHWADSVRPGTILFLSQPSGLHNACFGGIMATRTQRLGVEGVVVDGQVRDIGYIRSLNLPTFAKGVSIIGAGAECRPSAIDIPVRLSSVDQDIWVRPGDIIVGDVDGIRCCPNWFQAYPASSSLADNAADEKVLQEVSQGASVEEAFKRHRG